MDESAPKLFQVIYNDGGGEQIVGLSAEAVEKSRLEFWGDRKIVSVTEIIAKPNE